MKRIAALLLLACLAAEANAFEAFVVSDIRIDGLQRIAPGTVFTYLPIEKGDRVTSEDGEKAIRALFKTGFFNDVSLTRQGDILVVTVKERPAISKITIKGNKELKEEELRKGLKGIGLEEGETFDRLQLDRVQQELTRQYHNRGKYNVSITPKVTPLDRNRVDINIVIAEGKASRIKHINVVGNAIFTDKEIRDEFESDTSNWTSWYSKDDQYSREKLSGDLEKLASYYLDRGYADFNIDSTEVSISPDKRNIYVSANVHEGDLYKISDIKLLGELILPEESLRKLLRIQAGETFSRRKLEQSANAMSAVLSNIGYAFAEVTPVPKTDKEGKTVEVTFYVDPGKRVYVNRVMFKGNTRTEDEVLRREMRQLEGSWYSQAAIDRSKVRLQRLGFFKKVEIETPKVAGTEDQVDMVITVEEQPSGSLLFGLGYSQVQKLIASVAVSQNNFLGTGDKISLAVQRSSYMNRYDISYAQPYLTDSNISLGYNLSLRELDQGDANLANYLSDTAAFSTFVGVPIGETDGVQFQLGFSNNQITTLPGLTPSYIIRYITDLDHRTIHTWNLTASWAHDTRNKYFTPTRGGLQSISAEIALPGSTLEYYKLYYQGAHYFPLTDSLTFLLSGNLGYGDSYRNAIGREDPNAPVKGQRVVLSGLPFFENFYAGGVRDVRGFEDNTLGPCERVSQIDYCQPIGGAFKVLGSAELILPTPFAKNSDSVRISAFLDVGNVYRTFGDFDAGELRASTGLSLQWQAPVGPITVNLARPIRKKDGDRTETIQFSFGTQF
ncbi:outer membrane protein assembly factor BamA [Tahibacter amnicola]|uniref:Outer membrane protein assembly factor BamA n=1 Tax=Tahibacter amnicola TaxID=2976241 RepID=A0ABY6B9R6_9GAMM|nr:outer membrane protein assembly factor BamA [Tahibacter amnicola]UXI66801.1 outer membrane protein assembly factor BamA [Tahibacter amnicola]